MAYLGSVLLDFHFLWFHESLYFFLRGVGAGCNTKEVVDRLRYLEAEIEELELKEKELDQQKLWLQQSIKNVMDDSTNHQYPFQETVCILEQELKQQLKHR